MKAVECSRKHVSAGGAAIAVVALEGTKVPDKRWKMKNYLEARREELRKRGDKGFTLMEMLIVVAIIAVLIAIAIPVFTSQLERSREATDLANVRSAYAELMAEYLTWNGTDEIEDIEVPAKQVQENWQIDDDAETTTIAEGHTGDGIVVPFVLADGSYVVHIETTGEDAGVVTVN